jgi:two-component system sensor histidine kinase AgrC
MEILIVNIFSIIVQTIATCYLVLFIIPTIVEIDYNKKQMILFSAMIFISLSCVTFFKNILPGSNTLLITIIEFLLLTLILKFKPLKAMLITILILSIFAITEIISVYLTMFIFHTDMENVLSSWSKLLYTSILQFASIALTLNLQLIITKKKSVNLKLFNNITNKQILILISLIIVYVFPQMLIFMMNSYSYPISILVINSIQFVLIFIIAFKFVKNNLEYEKSQSELYISELHNKTLVSMVDGVRTLKHDYSNIIQALNGYVVTKQYDKLGEHINNLLKECHVVNNLSLVDPNVFNEPAIYGIVGSKYFLADKKNIPFNLKVSSDIASICFSKPELSRILGILLDNAIEATQKSNNPYLSLQIYYDERKCADIIKVINSYDNNIQIDLSSIFKKGFSTKEVKSGIGLWEVKKIIDKTSNSQIFSSIENENFVQTIIIEKNDDCELEYSLNYSMSSLNT